MAGLQGKKIAILVEELYNEHELWYPYYRLLEAGATVTRVGSGSAPIYKSKIGLPAPADAYDVPDFEDLRNKPEHTLNASLRYSVRLVESLHDELRLDATTCTCEACAWIRDSQRLIETFESSLSPNPHRPPH